MSTKNNAKEPVRLREKPLANGNKSLYLDIYRDGKRSYEFLKLYLVKATTPAEREQNRETLTLAQSIRAKRQIELQNGEYGFNSQFKEETLFLPYFRAMCDKRRDSKGNAGNWNSCLKHLERYCDESTTFKDITPQWIEGFKEHLNNANSDEHKRRNFKEKPETRLSQNSKVSYFNKLRACINQAFEERIIPYNPLRGVEGFKAEEKERVFLTIDELRALVKTPCRYDVLKRAFLFSCLTGLRKSDILNLKWKDVQQFDEYTRINFVQQKTKGRQYLDINQQATALMGERGNDDERVFEGFRYTSYTLVELNKWCAKAGITKDVTFHTGRHTFAVLMITQGVDLFTVSKLLGHKDIATTQLYANVVDTKRRDAINTIPNLLGGNID